MNVRNSTSYVYITSVLWIILLVIQIIQALQSPLSFDDGWWAVYARNWAHNGVPGLTLFDKDYPIGILALSSFLVWNGLGTIFILLFGNAYWVPALAGVFAIQVLILCCFFALRSIPECRDSRWKISFLLLLVWILCATGNFTHRPEYSFLWYSYHGDIPAALCVLLTALLLAGGETTGVRLWLISLIIGIASQIKPLTLLPNAILCIAFFWREYYQNGSLIAIKRLICLGFGAVTLQIGWSLYVIYCIGFDGFISAIVFSLHQIFVIASGSLTASGSKKRENTSIGNQLMLLFSQFGLFLLPFAVFYGTRYYHLLFKDRKELTRLEYYASALVIAGFLLGLWYIFFSAKLLRYAVPVTLYTMSGITILLVLRKKDFPYGIYALLLFCILGRGDDAFFTLFREGFLTHQSRNDMLNAKEELLKLNKEGYVLSGCGPNFEMEYIMDGSKHFIYCDIARKETHKFVILNTYLVYSFIGKVFSNTLTSVAIVSPPNWIAEECTKAFPSPYFEVWKCENTKKVKNSPNVPEN